MCVCVCVYTNSLDNGLRDQSPNWTIWYCRLTDQSAKVSNSGSLTACFFSVLPLIRPHTDRQTAALFTSSRAPVAFVRQPCWRRRARHTAPPRWHIGFVISTFRGGFGVILVPSLWNVKSSSVSPYPVKRHCREVHFFFKGIHHGGLGLYIHWKEAEELVLSSLPG